MKSEQELRRFKIETTSKKKHVDFHQYFVDFESRINLELSTLSQCHFFQVDSPLIIDEILTNFWREN